MLESLEQDLLLNAFVNETTNFLFLFLSQFELKFLPLASQTITFCFFNFFFFLLRKISPELTSVANLSLNFTWERLT